VLLEVERPGRAATRLPAPSTFFSGNFLAVSDDPARSPRRNKSLRLSRLLLADTGHRLVPARVGCAARNVLPSAMDVLQRSGWLAGDVKESRNENPTRNLHMAGGRNPASSFMSSSGIFAILFRYAMLRNCWRSVVSPSTTQRSGAGCNITSLSWSSDCDTISSRPTSLVSRQQLIDWGCAVCDAGMRCWVVKDASAPLQSPYGTLKRP
jgi:hypothetical protein